MYGACTAAELLHVTHVQIEGQCMVRSNTAQETVVGSILEAARVVEADSLVLGISGYIKAKLGSVSEECSQKSRCSILVLKVFI